MLGKLGYQNRNMSSPKSHGKMRECLHDKLLLSQYMFHFYFSKDSV